MKRHIPLILATALSLLSCRVSPVREALGELDQAIDKIEDYRLAFETQNDSLRKDLDWETARQLYDRYLHFSADSAGRYVALMEDLASTPVQKTRTCIARSYLYGAAHYEEQALSIYRTIDTTGLRAMGLWPEYLEAGIRIFTNISRVPRPLLDGTNYKDSLMTYRDAYIAADTISYEGRKLLAQRLRDQGQPERALAIFQDCFSVTSSTDYHQLTSIAYNMAILYGILGDIDNKIIWLAKSAVYDFKAPNRDFMSLNELALTLYQGKDYARASRYITIHFENVYAGDFLVQTLKSSGAQNIIAEAALEEQRQKQLVLAIGIIVLAILSFFVFWLLLIRHRQAEKLAVANSALEKANVELSNANIIKDNYVFRYMNLSVQYLDKIEQARHNYRQIARNQGTDALLKELRSPADYADYKEFYRIFDQTFLGIFPGFVASVNALLRKDAKFDVPSGGPLPTEIRILASIRLGIEDSPSIASFLKCSLSTVYTYRAKMRNQAIGPKEEFEHKIKEIK